MLIRKVNLMNERLSEVVGRYLTLLESRENLLVIEQFYADEIIQYENYEEPITGKKHCFDLECDNLRKVNRVKTQIKSVCIDESSGLVTGEMKIVFENKQKGLKLLEEAFVQQWSEGKIISQKFYYQEIREAEGEI